MACCEHELLLKVLLGHCCSSVTDLSPVAASGGAVVCLYCYYFLVYFYYTEASDEASWARTHSVHEVTCCLSQPTLWAWRGCTVCVTFEQPSRTVTLRGHLFWVNQDRLLTTDAAA